MRSRLFHHCSPRVTRVGELTSLGGDGSASVTRLWGDGLENVLL